MPGGIMNINSALRRMSALKGDISRLESRRMVAITYPVDAPPAWPLDVIENQLSVARTELTHLKVRLAVANATTKVPIPGEDERTLVELVIELQELKGQISQLDGLMSLTKASATYTQRSREYDYDSEKTITVDSEFRCDLTTQVLDARLQALRDRFAKLNAVLESANHTIEL
jgi:hypothetical protein